MPRTSLRPPDYLLIGLMLVLVAFGLLMLSSAGAVVGYEKFGQSDYFFRRQLFSTAVGLLAFFFLSRIDYHVWRKFAFPFLLLSVILLVMVFLPGIGFRAGGASRWILLGNFLLQPAEVVKLTFLVYLAVWLEKHAKGIHDFWYGFVQFLALLGIIVSLIMFQPDLGTVGVIVGLSIVVYFVAGAPYRHLALFGLGATGLFALLIKVAPYRTQRLTVFLNREIDPQGIGYHMNQALLAIGSGGIFGLGLGHSRQKYNYLPEVTGDSIFAIIAEELGLLVAAAVVVLFVVLLIRGFSVARNAPDPFGKYLATGITAGIVLQAFVNIGAISGILPLTGIPLPFISSGGSSLIMAMAGMGMLVNISRQTKK
ncbi:MAG: putative lipid II flippase FtsW [Candidatus Kerfeldbacteria bacterium]|nr:putative lipid II flippase FtsW [Candidatus Kerfeldbacteria bacterium]